MDEDLLKSAGRVLETINQLRDQYTNLARQYERLERLVDQYESHLEGGNEVTRDTEY